MHTHALSSILSAFAYLSCTFPGNVLHLASPATPLGSFDAMFRKETVQRWLACSGAKRASTQVVEERNITAAHIDRTDIAIATLSTTEHIDMATHATESLGILKVVHTQPDVAPNHASATPSHTLSAETSRHGSDSQTMEHDSKTVEPAFIDGTLIREYAVLELSYYMSSGMEALGQAWGRQEIAVPLELWMADLSGICDSACKIARRLNNRFMLDLQERGGGVHMSATVEFHDERDLYANKTTAGGPRIKTVRNLFRATDVARARQSGEPLTVPIAIDVSLRSESDAQPLPTAPTPRTNPLPSPPPMSFDEYPSPPTPLDDSGPIPLTIRVVNHLATLSLDDVPLPARISMTLRGPSQGQSMRRAMDVALGEELVGIAREIGPRDLPAQEWKVVWWVLPQTEPAARAKREKGGKKRGGKEGCLFRYERGSLRRFLDAEMVKEGKRELYVEAHLVPVGDYGGGRGVGSGEGEGEGEGDEDGGGLHVWVGMTAAAGLVRT